MFRPCLAFLAPLAVLAFAACGGSGAASSGGDTAPKPTQPAGDAASGEALYAELGCKGCHGEKGEEDTVGPSLFAISWDDHEREEARDAILAGKPAHKPPMPSYRGKVDDAKIADLLAYIEKK